MTISIIVLAVLATLIVGSWLASRRQRLPPEIPTEMVAADRSAFADELQMLLDLPLATEADVEAWYRACDASQERLRARRFGFPHYVYHWFSDADIRFKESGYREKQDSQIRELIGRYRHTTDVSHTKT